jgi:hypothetical protein
MRQSMRLKNWNQKPRMAALSAKWGRYPAIDVLREYIAFIAGRTALCRPADA